MPLVGKANKMTKKKNTHNNKDVKRVTIFTKLRFNHIYL